MNQLGIRCVSLIVLPTSDIREFSNSDLTQVTMIDLSIDFTSVWCRIGSHFLCDYENNSVNLKKSLVSSRASERWFSALKMCELLKEFSDPSVP